MNAKPTISGVIPCYNHGAFIDEAIESLLSQSYILDEIIIVNDGSEDELTKAKLLSFENNSRIIVYNIPNSGPSRARNFGIQQAKGDLILLMDADDYCHPTFAEKAGIILRDNADVGVVSSGAEIFGLESRKLSFKGGGIKDYLLKPQSLNFGLLRKACWERVGGYDETMRDAGFEDWDFWIEITKAGYRIEVIPEYLFFYRRHSVENSRRSKSMKKRIQLIERIVEKHQDIYAQYIVHVVVGKEKSLAVMRKEKEEVLGSLEYRVGRKLLAPVRQLQQLLIKLLP